MKPPPAISNRRRWCRRVLQAAGSLLSAPWLAAAASPPVPVARPLLVPVTHARGVLMAAAPELPPTIKRVVYAANQLIGKPYQWGGGHQRVHDTGYDCSGAVSSILTQAGLMKGSKNCRGFLTFGRAGRGRWLTLYVNRGHIFMKLCGQVFDVGVSGRQTGPLWRLAGRSTRSFQARHLPGC
jgi:hypothetical protein